MSDDSPKKVRQRVKVRVRTNKPSQPREYPKWLRLGLTVLFWTAILVAVVLANYWLLGKLGNPTE